MSLQEKSNVIIHLLNGSLASEKVSLLKAKASSDRNQNMLEPSVKNNLGVNIIIYLGDSERSTLQPLAEKTEE